MRLNNYNSPMRVGKQSILNDISMYFKILLFKNYYSGVEYEVDSPRALIST